jgi:hypothetical protein
MSKVIKGNIFLPLLLDEWLLMPSLNTKNPFNYNIKCNSPLYFLRDASFK